MIAAERRNEGGLLEIYLDLPSLIILVRYSVEVLLLDGFTPTFSCVGGNMLSGGVLGPLC